MFLKIIIFPSTLKFKLIDVMLGFVKQKTLDAIPNTWLIFDAITNQKCKFMKARVMFQFENEGRR